ncbi:hypothetical protein LTR91_013264 [Friedmanniomyces endolithicus]|uniref:Uncharacterized protein n=1 Tax=Friedmanniomyces endolithicus TaxID=329885 RepID=A0AAN6KDV5_9PEZI|nr:hypothetical protein LTR94_015351 [Friedmanniomyces endolithicus]KAK0789821.1 hypothetical protein LTR59_009470 [Friedmanniomyces endolithicus]KAK0802073.1 hypothetical protein LTR75_008370 [Friedmanniomyces endolithicus]KAK0807896.1 hypothetical protein LTR38_004711 [Friedmanniomyces endolithicus]KAK0843883.1 hypothetical protein LTR03_008368 [Friedmanniomyces endolithicus]
MPHIVLLGTCDTKLVELLYLRSQILESGGPTCRITFVDVGRTPSAHEHIDVRQDTIAKEYAPESGAKDVSNLPRGEVIRYMIACATKWLAEAYMKGLQDPDAAIHGCINAGGTGNTSLASAVMREVLPIGLPKLIVSTNASGDMGPIVGESDVTMMYSVCDIAGLNYLLRRILSNAAGAIAGMAQAYERSIAASPHGMSVQQKKRVGLTMFGVTTRCVDKIRDHLESYYDIECFVFHQLCGGVMDAGPLRLEAPLKAGIPYIVSVGATDMVNFGPRSTVPERYQHRNLYEHNPTVTLMRTNAEECRAIGDFIVKKVEHYTKDTAQAQVVLPLGGVSMIATPGGPFHDAEADEALFSTVRAGLKGSKVLVVEDDRSINDEGFAVDVAERLVHLMGLSRKDAAQRTQ